MEKNKILIIFVLILATSVFLLQAKAAPSNSCPNLGDLGYCKDGDYSYYCGVKFNESESFSITFAGGKIKIDKNGNILFDYYNEKILSFLYTDEQGLIIDTNNYDLVITKDNLILNEGVKSIVENDGEIGERLKTSSDFEIKNSDGERVVLFESSTGKFYLKGNRIIDGLKIDNNNDFFTDYNVGEEEIKPHYCKKFGEKFTLENGCFIGLQNILPEDKKINNDCLECNPEKDLFDWTAVVTGEDCVLNNELQGKCDGKGDCVGCNLSCPEDKPFCNFSTEDGPVCVQCLEAKDCNVNNICNPTVNECQPIGFAPTVGQ
ncbi:MAG: hypothetical protein ABIH48_02345 [Candidatus Falkowbacteria bacterium]